MDKKYITTIQQLMKLFDQEDLHVCIGGGYAIDGFLNRVTRSHDDLDVDIVGKISYEKGRNLLKNSLKQQFSEITQKERHFKIEENGMNIDIEYIQDLSNEKRYRYLFGIGEFETPFPLYLTKGGRLEGLSFDIEEPHMIFAIKYLMPISKEKEIRQKDQEDIENLLPHLNKNRLIQALRFQLDYISK